ncbi:MAG: glutamate mutase L [Caldilineaceae bacterium]|nr:glutamate mutase L [Caldilineaceae bacterium]
MQATSSAAGLSATPGSILAVGIELSAIRACLLEEVSGTYRVAAWHTLPRRKDASLAATGVDLCRQMGERLDRVLVDEATAAPLVTSDDSVRFPPLQHIAVAASPRPHLRIWIAGLSMTQSMEATYEALCGSPAHVIGYTVLGADINTTALTDAIVTTAPDILVIVGGFDDPDPATHRLLVELSRLIGQALARLAPAQRPAVIYAGNRWAAPHVAEAVQAAGGGAVESVANVQPAPGVAHKTALARACHFHYWRLSRRTPGFREISRWVTPPGHITSLESAFAQLVQAWMELHGLPELHGLYCAPAWWLHVWAIPSQLGLNMRYIEPQTRPSALHGWPPLQLVSGDWPVALWPQPEIFWWDRSSMAPLLASVGQLAPQAMIQGLRADLLRLRGQ